MSVTRSHYVDCTLIHFVSVFLNRNIAVHLAVVSVRKTVHAVRNITTMTRTQFPSTIENDTFIISTLKIRRHVTFNFRVEVMVIAWSDRLLVRAGLKKQLRDPK